MKTFKPGDITDAALNAMNPVLILKTAEEITMYEKDDELPVLGDTLSAARMQAVQMLSAVKWSIIENGVTLNTFKIATDKNSLLAILNAKLIDDPNLIINWKTLDTNSYGLSEYVKIDKETLDSLHKMIFDKYQKCFNVEYEKQNELLQLDTEEQISLWLKYELYNGWPK